MAATRVRNFEALLKFKIKSPERRKNLYKTLITAFVQHERIETTLSRCQDLSRVAERVRILSSKDKDLRQKRGKFAGRVYFNAK